MFKNTPNTQRKNQKKYERKDLLLRTEKEKQMKMNVLVATFF